MYESFVSEHPDFLRLKNMKEEGYNIQLAGSILIQGTPIEHYVKDAVLFDDSVALYCMLVIPESNDYPWNLALKFENIF